jgi:hypothetical protein
MCVCDDEKDVVVPAIETSNKVCLMVYARRDCFSAAEELPRWNDGEGLSPTCEAGTPSFVPLFYIAKVPSNASLLCFLYALENKEKRINTAC